MLFPGLVKTKKLYIREQMQAFCLVHSFIKFLGLLPSSDILIIYVVIMCQHLELVFVKVVFLSPIAPKENKFHTKHIVDFIKV